MNIKVVGGSFNMFSAITDIRPENFEPEGQPCEYGHMYA